MSEKRDLRAAARRRENPHLPQNQPRPPSPQIREAIELLLRGEVGTIRAAAERVGLREDSLQKALKRPKVEEYREKRAAEMTRAMLRFGSPMAAREVARLIESASSERVRLQAAEALLDRTGHARTGPDGGERAPGQGMSVLIVAGYADSGLRAAVEGAAGVRVIDGEVVEPVPAASVTLPRPEEIEP